MLLFKPYHVFPIISEDPKIQKTETRRIWKKCRVKIGAIHQCRLSYYDAPGFASVEITDVYEQPLGEMTEEATIREGGYTLPEYKKIWEIIGNRPWNPMEEVFVVEIQIAKVNLAQETIKKYETMYRAHMQALRGIA
jgi:hypothetical protein